MFLTFADVKGVSMRHIPLPLLNGLMTRFGFEPNLEGGPLL